jgi:anaerobic magnesium-protoporphyrin IX monomethyl ester cyclase
MRVVLLYPPPWKIAEPAHPSSADQPNPFGTEGPPPEFKQGDLDADFHQTPYGLFALGAAAKRAGHRVKVVNLSGYSWSRVEAVLKDLDSDLYGISCWTANRRGVGYVTQLLKALRPHVPVLVGGPHATPLAQEMLSHHPHIDLIARGESDNTLLEVLERIKHGASLDGIAGTAYRVAGVPTLAPERPNVKHLDELACPQKMFDTHIFMTSRGCPWACTFCGAETSWGRGFRANSVKYVADAIESVLARLPVKMIQIKDDTFTTHKKRVLELCDELRRRNLKFFWSCDTRVDLLNDELLRAMRLAGCERLSLGVESGSQTVLDAIDKKITVDEIVESTHLAKKYGIKVRHYMMVGNRGETRETLRETEAFLQRAKPHEYVFACLSVYPGTRDFDDSVMAKGQPKTKTRWLDPSLYFTDPFQELKTPFDASESDAQYFNDWFRARRGLQITPPEGVQAYKAVLVALGEEHHAAHMDLGAAYYREGDLVAAEKHVRRALELGYPLPGLVYNHLACFAYARGDLDGMMNAFDTAAKLDPQHFVLMRNVERARMWFKNGGYDRKEPLDLDVRHDFQLFERTQQPSLPGPLTPDFFQWEAHDPAPEPLPALDPVLYKTPEEEGSMAELRPRLRVL